MIKSIKLKLWLALFVTLALSLGTLLAISFISVKQQFLDYTTQQILERLEPLEQAVVDIYKDEQSLAAFAEAPARWNQLRDTTYRQYLSYHNRVSAMAGAKPQDWSEHESIEDQLRPKQRAFFQHLVLLDAQQKLITGRKKEGANYILRELRYNKRLIAHIGYIKPRAFLRSVDKLFVEQQVRTLGVLTGLMILASLIVTAFVSRWLVKPLTQLAENANSVAGGDFSVRVGYKANDELGKLCQNFDAMTESLGKNETLRKQWVADISHEMRTPLSVLKAQLEAMEDGIRQPNQENLQLLHRNVDSLSLIINDLYELSLTDLGVLSLNKENLTLQNVLLSTLENFDEKYQQKELKINADFSPDLQSTILADNNRIQQLFTNLLENTFRYTDKGGQLHVNIVDSPTQVIVTLEDSFPGVPDEDLKRIYDRLYRIESSRNRETGGAGLGLSICKGIIGMHGGSIHAEHSSLGGLKQTLTFPKIT